MHIGPQYEHVRSHLPQDRNHRRTVSYSEAFDPNDPTLIDRNPEYDIDKHLGDRPPTPTQQRENRYRLKANRKKEYASMKSNLTAIPDEGQLDVKFNN